MYETLVGKKVQVCVKNYKIPERDFFYNGILKDVDKQGIELETANGPLFVSFNIITKIYLDRR